MGALDLAAVRALPPVGNQPRDRGADRWNLLDELLDRRDLFNRASALWAGREWHLGVHIDMHGNGAVGTGMPLGATGPFLLLVGDFLGLSTTERRRLTKCLTLGVIEFVAEGLILSHQIGDSLL
jgi:hypothetical protein